MRERHRGPTTSALAIAAAALAAPALAQSAPPDGGGNGDIIVTARRVEERLQDVPISITVFNQQQLNSRNIVNTADLATYTPSLAVNARFGPDKASFALRGFSQDLNTQPTVAIYFADVVAPRLQSNTASGNGAGVGSLFDLQNLQVLKGPQGTLFGRNTTGGAILLVPQKPTGRLEGYVEGTVGNYGQRRVQAVLNVPLSDSIRLRAGVDRNVRDGYVHNRSGIGPDDFNNINYWAARLSLTIDVTPDLENYSILTFSRSDTHGTVGKAGYCLTGALAGAAAIFRNAVCSQISRESGYGYYDVENVAPHPAVVGRQWQAINTTTWKAADTLTVKNIASYGESRERYSFSLAGDTIPLAILNPGPTGPQGNQWTLTEELQLQGRTGNDKLTWQAGGYLERSEPAGQQEQYTQLFTACTDVYTFRCTPLTAGAAILGSVSAARNSYYYRDYGLYAQATYRLTDRLSLTAGIRNTWDSVRESADTVRVVTTPAGVVSYSCTRAVTPVNPGPGLIGSGSCTRAFRTASHRPTWLLDVDYKPLPDVLLYAKWARGYRGGGVNEANLGAEIWRPEKIDDYEVGVKASFRGNGFTGTFDVDGFWNDFRDQQSTVVIPACTAVTPGCTSPAATGINGIQNVGKSRIRGVEVDGSVTLLRDLRFDVGYAFLDAKVLGASAPFCDSRAYLCSGAVFLTPGTTLPFAPRNRVTVTGTYTLPIHDPKIGRFAIGATFTHTDRQYNSHTDDPFFAAGKTPYNASISPATDLLNLNLSWTGVAGLPLDLSAFATNVTKQKYYVAAAGVAATIGGEYLILGEPRVFGVRARLRFGQ